MKILIVDDESLARERLVSLINEIDAGYGIIEAEHGLAALDKISTEHPDIVLLDIRMPVMDGLEVAHHLTQLEHPPAVIFTTAYQDHALQAFESRAVDYLLKPVRKNRLEQALGRAGILQRAHISEIRKNDAASQTRTHLSAAIHNQLRLVPVRDIRYFKAEQKYVIAGWPGGELLLDESLIALEEEFGSRFLRIHRNALVAREYIDSLIKNSDGTSAVKLAGVPAALQVSRRNLGCLRERIKSGK
jgi:two-component system response regulator AlgR